MITVQVYDSPCTLDGSGNPSNACRQAPVIQNDKIANQGTAIRNGRAWLDRYGRAWRTGTVTSPKPVNYLTGEIIQISMADFGLVRGVISGVENSLVFGDDLEPGATISFRFIDN